MVVVKTSDSVAHIQTNKILRRKTLLMLYYDFITEIIALFFHNPNMQWVAGVEV